MSIENTEKNLEASAPALSAKSDGPQPPLPTTSIEPKCITSDLEFREFVGKEEVAAGRPDVRARQGRSTDLEWWRGILFGCQWKL
jgi:hypothetical protein